MQIAKILRKYPSLYNSLKDSTFDSVISQYTSETILNLKKDIDYILMAEDFDVPLSLTSWGDLINFVDIAVKDITDYQVNKKIIEISLLSWMTENRFKVLRSRIFKGTDFESDINYFSKLYNDNEKRIKQGKIVDFQNKLIEKGNFWSSELEEFLRETVEFKLTDPTYSQMKAYRKASGQNLYNSLFSTELV
tara:strand:- start:19468 stop:20043 length:576 start_codon:yes stop_codon:yes gene_type:complete